MRHIIGIALIFTFASCGNNQSSTVNASDSTTVKVSTASADTSVESTGAATGTTGTGTISDSGNAAKSGSGIKVDSTDNARRTTSLNGKDTVSR